METKAELINRILTFVNSIAVPEQKKADANMFFSLAFMSEDELITLSKKIGLK